MSQGFVALVGEPNVLTLNPIATLQRLAGLEVLRSADSHPLSYAEVEALARLLSVRLRESLEPEWLASCRAIALPRGGLVVAGILSYFLDLRPGQLSGDAGRADQPVLLIDDCALSGTKLSRKLKRLPSPDVVCATLCSPPQLRGAMAAAEPRLRRFESSRDLADLSEQHFPDPSKRDAWRERWRERRPEAYWIGLPEIVSFPWSEPDHPVWNAETGQLEVGWRLIPADQCLKNWSQLGLPPVAVERCYRPASGVAYRLSPSSILLCRLHDGVLFELNGVAADMWRALAAYGEPGAVEAYLQSRYQASPSELSQDLDSFTQDLIRHNLLTQDPLR